MHSQVLSPVCAKTPVLCLSIRRAALKVLHMTRTESSSRIMPHLKGYLDYVLRAASDLYPGGTPFEGSNAFIGLKIVSLCSIYAPPAKSSGVK